MNKDQEIGDKAYSKVNSGVQMEELSDEELKTILITIDGLGKVQKEKALNILLERESAMLRANIAGEIR